MKKKRQSVRTILPKLFLILIVVFMGFVGARSLSKPAQTVVDNSFGWKYPVASFPNVGPKDQDLIAYSDIRDPGGVPQGLPIRLKIPAIGVDSAIEDALITSDGRMDVPAGTINVAWFALGPHPGNVGSAVIGGHFGIDSGVPRVFYNLDKIKVDDKVYIEDDRGDTLAFQVRKIELFDRNADATTVFTSQDGLAHLNLITCEGIWNQVNDTYPDRRVVFTDAIASEGPISINPKLPETALSTSESDSAPNQTEPSLTQNNDIIFTLKSLYATPKDGLITSFLIISIFFMVFKIMRR